MKSSSLLFITLIVLSGCAVGPNYQTPEIALPESYEETKKLSEEDAAELLSWWTEFNDPKLDLFIQEAIEQNFDLRIAIEKLNEVRALYQIKAAELAPKVDLIAEENRSRISQTLFDSPFLGPPLQNFYNIGFDASWEIDIFGKRRREKESAFYTYEAEVENARSIYITLLSEVARQYINTCSLQKQIDLLRQKINVQTALLELTLSRFDAGLDSEISAQEISSELEASRAALPPLQSQLKRAIYGLGVLLGKTPETFESEFETSSEIPYSAKAIPVGLPSDLLRRRPDIRQAERQLAAATANIGAAIADLFPRFSLIGGIGLQSDRSKEWFKSNSRAWTIGPFMDWPILYFGRIRENINAQNAAQKQALLAYEQTILAALQDVESSLISYYKEEERRESLEKETKSRWRIYELKRDLYESGLENFQSFLEADQNLISAQTDLVNSTELVSTKLVALYKALGGEW